MGLAMNNRIWEVPAFRMTIELDKLARDEKKIKKVFEILEECRIPCECMALNIDSLSTAVRKSEQDKIEGFEKQLKGQLGQVDIVTEDGVALLCVESRLLRGRRIGMIVSSLSMQDIEIKMQRYLLYKNLLMVCVAMDKVERAREIIVEALETGNDFGIAESR